MARFSPDRAVPGLLSQHGGTSGTARRATVPLSVVPCRAVPDRARTRAGPGGPVGQLLPCLPRVKTRSFPGQAMATHSASYPS